MKILANRYTLIAASFILGIAAAALIANAGTVHDGDARPEPQPAQMSVPF
jgi:hypothetical protein